MSIRNGVNISIPWAMNYIGDYAKKGIEKVRAKYDTATAKLGQHRMDRTAKNPELEKNSRFSQRQTVKLDPSKLGIADAKAAKLASGPPKKPLPPLPSGNINQVRVQAKTAESLPRNISNQPVANGPDIKAETAKKIQNAIENLDGDIDQTHFEKYGVSQQKGEIDGVKYEINYYKKGAYNGAKTEGFIVRLDTAYKAIREKFAGDEKFLQIFDKLYNECKGDINKNCQLDVETMKDPKTSIPHYKKAHAIAEEKIAQFLTDSVHLRNSVGTQGAKPCKLADLQQMEKDYIVNHGRPVVINVFFAGDKKFVSAQFPETKHGEALPSSVRYKDGLSNYVTTAFGELNENNQVNISYQAVRHTIITPIAIEDKHTRQAMGVNNVKQSLKDWADKKKTDKNNGDTKEQAIEVDLRTMMLLTPVVGDDFLRNKSNGKWKGEGEYTQFKESALILASFNNQTIDIGTEGNPKWVKVSSSTMNLGVNEVAAKNTVLGGVAQGLTKLLGQQGRQDALNAKGFLEFQRDINKFLGLENKDVPKTMHELNNNIQNDFSELHASYGQLLQLDKEGKNTDDIKKKIDNLTGQIEKKEKELGKLNLKQVNEFSKQYTGGNNLKRNLNEMNEQLKFINDPEKRDIYKLFCRAKEVFLTGDFAKSDTVMEFQKIYINLHSKMSNCIEFNCKSGEDRSGRVDDAVQEMELKKLLNGSISDDEIMHTIHQFSASQNNTEWNSGARGLQISAAVNDKSIATIDNKNSKLAKEVYTVAKEIKNPSVAVRAYIEDSKKYLNSVK